MTGTSKDKGKKRKKDKEATEVPYQKKQHKEKRVNGYFFCGAVGHKKSNVPTIMLGVQRKGCLSCRKPNDGERYIFVGDGKKVEVEAIGTFRLFLNLVLIWI